MSSGRFLSRACCHGDAQKHSGWEKVVGLFPGSGSPDISLFLPAKIRKPLILICASAPDFPAQTTACSRRPSILLHIFFAHCHQSGIISALTRRLTCCRSWLRCRSAEWLFLTNGIFLSASDGSRQWPRTFPCVWLCNLFLRLSVASNSLII